MKKVVGNTTTFSVCNYYKVTNSVTTNASGQCTSAQVPSAKNPQDLNRYTYVRNNPLNYIDPSGHACAPIGKGARCTDMERMDTTALHVALDMAGLADPTPISDGTNALLYAAEGNWEDAGLSAISIVPIVGDVIGKGGKAIKYGAKAAKYADEAAQAAKAIAQSYKSLDSGILEIALRAENYDLTKLKGLPDQIHHAASDKNLKTWTKQFEGVANKYGLKLNANWNKVGIPHQGRHPDEYHGWIYGQMIEIDRIAKGDRETFLRLYDQYINDILRDHPEVIRYDFWR